MRPVRSFFLGSAVVLAGWLPGGHQAATRAGVYNIHLYTDSAPDLTDRESFLGSLLPTWHTPADSAATVWRSVVRMKRQAPPTWEDGRAIWDPIYYLNSYGSLDCGYVSAFLQSLFEGMGPHWRSCYVELGGHTVAEASWDGGSTWHMFDASMNYHCLNHAGQVASVDEIASAESCPLSLALGAPGPEPGHFYLYHSAPGTATNPSDAAHPHIHDPWGHRLGTDNPVPSSRTLRNGADPYIDDGYSRQFLYTHSHHGWSHRLHLRAGESYTRYWQSLGSTPDYYRPDIRGENPDLYDVGNIQGGNLRSNGAWEFRPDLSQVSYRNSIHSESNIEHWSEGSDFGPALRPHSSAVPGDITFKIYPASVATSGSIELRGQRTTAADSVLVFVSRDGGRGWTRVHAVGTLGSFASAIPLPASLLGGAMEYLVRVRLQAATVTTNCGLDEISIQTVTQLNPRALPGLRLGENNVRLFLGPQEESDVLWPVLHDTLGGPGFARTAFKSEKVVASTQPNVLYEAVVRPMFANQPGLVQWWFATPRPITRVSYGGMFHSRFELPGDYVELSHSFDGTTFAVDARYDARPTLNGRLFADVLPPSAGEQNLYLQFGLGCQQDADWTSTGIQSLLMSVSYEPPDATFRPVDVTYCWIEHRRGGDFERTHRFRVASPDFTWPITVGGFREPTMKWIRIELADDVAWPERPPYGYGDALPPLIEGDTDRRQYRAEWLDNAAWKKPYTVSRPAYALNPDSGFELTNGGIIAPTDYADGASDQLAATWQPGGVVEVTIDLQERASIAGFCITTHQPGVVFCHPAAIDVLVSDDGLAFTLVGTVQHDAVWNPPGDRLDFEMFDSIQFADYPAQGRLAFPFWLVPESAVEGRYLRCRFHPLPGRGMSLSEIQAFRSVQVRDWPDREIYLPDPPVSGIDPPAPDPGVAQPRLRITSSPNPTRGAVQLVVAERSDPGMDVAILDLRGRLVVRLGRGRLRGTSTVFEWDGRDARGGRAPAGVYFALFRTQGARSQARFVLLPNR